MLDRQLLQPFLTRQGSLESFDPSIEVILGLIEDFICGKGLEDLGLTVEDLSRKEKFRQLLDWHVGLSPLLFEEL